MLREDIAQRYAGEPEAMAEALEDLEERVLGSEEPERTSLYSADRDAAWARLGG